MGFDHLQPSLRLHHAPCNTSNWASNLSGKPQNRLQLTFVSQIAGPTRAEEARAAIGH